MLRHYSHIRMEAKRTALESIVKKQSNGIAEKKEDTQLADGAKRAGYPQRVLTLPPQNVSLSKLLYWRKGHEDDEGNAWSLHA
jgi:hypothetical protein